MSEAIEPIRCFNTSCLSWESECEAGGCKSLACLKPVVRERLKELTARARKTEAENQDLRRANEGLHRRLTMAQASLCMKRG